MTRTDSLVVGTLVVMLAILAGLVGVPALSPAATTTADPSQSPAVDVATRSYREGVLGHPVSVSPFSARTQADRDLVALVFSGLVRNGPSGTLVPDLAERWSVDPSGFVWTFQLRDDAVWHDGEPVTAEDVAFTIRVLQDPAYHGPAAGSWNEVTVQATAPRTVMFTLKTPLGGFLQAATQPIAPAHLLASVPIADLPDHPFGRQPIGSGPFALASLTDDAAELIPAASLHLDGAPGPGATPRSTDSLASTPPRGRPTRPMPYLAGIELRFFDDDERARGCLSIGQPRCGVGPLAGDGPRARGDGREPDPELSRRDLDHRPAQPSTGPPRVLEAGRPDGAARGHRPEPDHHRRIRDGRQARDRAHPARVGAVRSGRRPARPV